MKFNRNEHSRFVQWLDRTAEKNPLLWLPCVLLIALALAGEHIVEYAKIVYLHRNTEKVAKERPQLERKPFVMRVVAMTLVMSLSFMFVPEISNILSLDIYAVENWNEDFDLMEYIAYDIIYTKEDDTDDTNFYSDYAKNTMDFYFNDFRSMSEIWMDCMTPEFENSVKAWETTNLILRPEDAADKAIDAKGYYMTIIINMMNSTFSSKSIAEKLNNKQAKNISSVYNGFAKLFKQMSNQDIEDYLKKGSFTDDEKALLRAVQERYLEDNKLLNAGQAASDIFSVLEAAQKPEQYIEAFIEYCNVYNTTEEWKQFLQYMYQNCDKSNYALCSALETLIDVTKDINGAVRQLWQKGFEEVGADIYQYCVGGLIDLVVKDSNPFVIGMDIGASIGKPLSNLISGTDGIVKGYYIVRAYSEIMQLLRGAYKVAEGDFKANRNPQTAKAFINYVNMYYTALHVGNDYGLDFANAVCNGGILNKIIYSEGQYEEYVKRHKNFDNYITWACDTVNNHWIHNLYWDRPDLYEEYAPLIKNMNYIDPTRIEFEKDSVEWGLDDIEFNGAQYTVYPNEATNKEVIITSSDESVATLDNYGNVKVFKAGTCQITVTTFVNEFVCDTLNVTVVDGHGADSVALSDIIPITPDIVNESNFEYNISRGEVTITKYIGTDTDVVIPKTIKGKPVKWISSAFKDNENIVSVQIPDGVTSIYDYAFYGCTSLTSITIPNSVASIYDYVFSGCTSLTDVTIPSSVTSIGDYAFEGCKSLTSITISNGVTSIGKRVFWMCTSLTSITIPNSVTSIGGSAFYGCTSLTSITIPDSVTSIGASAFYGCTSLTSIIIPDSVTSIGGSAFYGCISLTSIVIPDSVTSIEPYAFRDCTSLKSIIIDYGVTSIWWAAFSGCTGLTSITIPESVTSIGNSAFYGCVSLTSIDIPNSVTSIEKYAFYNCTNLTSIDIPDSVVSISEWAFYNCTSLTNITIPDSVTSIEDYTFEKCTSLTNITIPNSVTSIGNSAFENCTSLTDITIPSSVTSIGNYTFSGCTSLTSITIPNSVTSIGYWSFGNFKNLTSVTLPNSITFIGDSAFSGCTSLTSITIPNSVTSIDDYAFRDCTSLTSITIPDSVTSIGNRVFSGCANLTSITIPDSVTSMGYWSFENFKNLTSVTLPNSITSINDFYFSGCTSLTNITIPNSVISIGDHAFKGCTSLISITIPDSVTSIGGAAFSGCTSLTSIIIPDSVTSIGGSAFYGCTSLTSITIPNSVTSIGEYAFNGCTSLKSIIIDYGITSIWWAAFSGCTGLTSITIPDSVTSIDIYAFSDCTSLTSITIPNSVTSIGLNAFNGCTSLTSITIPDSVTSIGGYAFDDCTNLTSITIPDSVISIGKFAFSGCKKITIYGYKDSYAESYAKKNWIPFVYLDDVPTDKILDIIESADENTTLTIDTSKYGTDLTVAEVSAAKDKNLTLIVNGNNFSWRTNAADLPNTAVDFKLISPSGSVDKSQFNDSYKNRSFDIKTVNPSSSELTYNVGVENNGYCANIFKVENGNFTPISSDLVDNGQITFIPSDNSTYCIVISTDSNPIDADELFEKTPVVDTALASLSVNGTAISGFYPDKTDYIYSISYADWLADSSRIYNISASANNSATVTVSENNFTLSSDNYDTATAKDVTVTVTSNDSDKTVYTVKFVVEACPHTNKTENTSKNPTCTELGERETVCLVCGKNFGTENIPALGHDFGNGTITSEPDCTNTGTMLYQCSRCTESFTRTINSLGHRWEAVTVDTAATCTTDGISSRHCEACGVHGNETLIPASGHSFGAWAKVDDTTYERVCASCGAKETKNVTDITHDHIFNGRIEVISEADCQNTGSRKVYCSTPDCMEFVTEETAKTAHISNESVVVNATCTTAGSSVAYCAVCNTKLSETELPATGHSFANYTDTATCTLPGIRTAMCDNGCGTSDSIPTPAKGHSYGDWLSNDMGHWRVCSECRGTTSVISHSENSGVITTPATETTDGVKTYSCTDCGYVIRTEVIRAINPHIHSFSTHWSYDNISHWHKCTVCGERSDTSYHTENNGIVTVQPTATTSGTRTYYCSVCGYAVRTETISPTDNPNPPYPVNPAPSYPTVTYPTTGTQTENEPYIYSDTSKTGWDVVISEIDFAMDGSTVRINMNGTTELPQAVVSHIQNRNINLELNMGSAVWTINGLDVTNPKTVNMRVSDRSNKIPDSVMVSLYSELTAKQLHLYHSGNFGFTAKLALNVGKKYNGYYATLYYYNTKTKQLEYNSQSYVSGGIAEFEFVHASYYAIGFSSEPIFDDVSSSAGVVDFGTLVDVDSPVTNGVRIPQAVIPRGFKLSNKKRKYRILKKRRLDDLVFVF